MADRVDVVMMTPSSLRSGEALARILDALEGAELAPTHWGEDERARQPYDRDGLVKSVEDLDDDFFTVGLRRAKAPRYSAFMVSNGRGLSTVQLELTGKHPAPVLARVFELGDAFADALHPVFGCVNVVATGVGNEYGGAAKIRSDELEQYGPMALCTRTWLGPHVARLVGRDRLADSGAVVTDTTWGGVRVDLLDEPWRHDVKELVAHHRSVMSRLRPTGIFGDYSKASRSPGDAWVRVPASVQ